MFGNKVGHLGCVGSLTLAQRVSAMLFSRGEPGAWYDPSDLSTLFQDSAGTVPVTAVEQPVGRILDKSGRGNHAIQATTTKRPVYSRRVNLLLATATLATQSMTTTAAAYTLAFSGAGSVTLSGAATGTFGAGTYVITCTAGSLTLTVAGAVNDADFRLAVDAHLPYQWVNTATNYDADPAKFPAYRSLDGVDDSHASATGGGGTSGFFFSAAVTPQGGAGTARTLFSDAGTNTGYIVRLNTSNQLELSAGNGTTYTTIATAGTLAVGSTDIVQAWDDGTNLNVKIGNGATASIARPTVSAGTAGYTMGQDNGASTGYFNGRIYSTIYRKDSGLTQVQRESVALYQRQKARMP